MRGARLGLALLGGLALSSLSFDAGRAAGFGYAPSFVRPLYKGRYAPISTVANPLVSAEYKATPDYNAVLDLRFCAADQELSIRGRSRLSPAPLVGLKRHRGGVSLEILRRVCEPRPRRPRRPARAGERGRFKARPARGRSRTGAENRQFPQASCDGAGGPERVLAREHRPLESWSRRDGPAFGVGRGARERPLPVEPVKEDGAP
jgi:hypothetical protein